MHLVNFIVGRIILRSNKSDVDGIDRILKIQARTNQIKSTIKQYVFKRENGSIFNAWLN